jgi:glycine cleavage system H lipoate-binding protein
MRCPFLREEQVRSCQGAPFRKQIACAALLQTSERCTSAAYASCPNLRESHTDHPSSGRCPFLRESLVQYCAATPAPTYVPWSDSPDLCCGHDGHRFCDVFLALVGAKGRRPARPQADPADERVFDVAGVAVPGWVQHSANHLWLDVVDDGLLHVGLDAFAAGWLSSVDRLTFLTLKGTVHPAVVLTVKGVDLTLCFPRRLRILSANTHLRFNLKPLIADPYGRGWLFRARAAAQEAPGAELLSGGAAREWMAAEIRRGAELLHQLLPTRADGIGLVADGGTPAADVLAHLEREEILRLGAALFPLPIGAAEGR